MRMIRTTINIDSAVYQQIVQAATEKGMSFEDIVLVLLRFYARKYHKELITEHSVQYQERKKDGYRCVHVWWDSEEYEFLIDLRKVHKKSVSFLIAEAFGSFFVLLSSIIDSDMDNYQRHQYNISKFYLQNIIGCTFLWIYPQNQAPD